MTKTKALTRAARANSSGPRPKRSEPQATEGKEFRYGSIGLPLDLWGPWRVAADDDTPALGRIRDAVESMLRPHVVLDLLANFTAYATDKKKRRIKIVARHQQYEATNQIVERVVAGREHEAGVTGVLRDAALQPPHGVVRGAVRALRRLGLAVPQAAHAVRTPGRPDAGPRRHL